MLVIDDCSPDGTGELADALAAELAFVDVLHRARKEGLGPAYLAGFRRALDGRRRAHPRDGLRLLARPGRRAASARRRPSDADLVLGSRYVARRRASVNWGLLRRSISRGRLACTRRCCSGVGIRDLTGGFKCFHRAVLEAIDLDVVDSHGLRVPDRDDVPRAAGRASAWSRFRSCSPTARSAARR